MADYNISVSVDVDDGQLNSLETKLNNLQSKPIKIKIESEFVNAKDLANSIKKDVKAAVKEAQKAVKADSSPILDNLLDTDKLDKFTKNIKSISKIVGKELNLGTVSLTVPDSIMNDLNQLHNKLNEIKTTAKSMGSIKLKVSDKMDLVDGELIVGSSGKANNEKSYKQLKSKLQRNVEAITRNQLDIDKNLRTKSKTAADEANAPLQKMIEQLEVEQQQIWEDVNKRYGITEKSEIARMLDDAEEASKRRVELAKNENNAYEKEFQSLNRNSQKYAELNKNSKDYFKNSLSKGYSERLDLLNESMENAATLRESMKNMTDPKEIADANSKMAGYIEAAKIQDKYLKKYDQFLINTKSNYSSNEHIGINASTEQIQRQMNNMAAVAAKGKKFTTEFDATQKKMIATIDMGSGLIEKQTFKYSEASGDINGYLSHVSQQIKPFSSYISDLGEKFKNLSQYLISNFGFEALQMGVTSGISAIKELDSAMVELKKTSEGTKQQYSEFTAQANKDAKAIGSTTTQITESAASWSRLGYNLTDSSTMAKETGVLKNVSEFETIEDATNSLVGIMQAYNIEAKDARALIDQLNKIGNSYSISTSGLAEALQISGSMLQVAGNTKEQSMAIVTAMNSSIQNPAQAARAARTVAMRLTGVDSETLQAEGEDIDGLIESVPKLEAKIKSLTAVNGKMGVSLTDSVGNFRSTYEILLDIAERWQEIQEADKKDGKNRANDLLETAAGPEKKPENYGNIVLENIFNCKVSLKLYATI